MKLANDVEEQKRQEAIIEAWKEANGWKEPEKNDQDASEMTIMEVVKTALVKPWAWLFGSILVFSPYGVEIVNAILNFFKN